MKISALLTSAGINIGLSVLFLSLYSILRKQPTFARVYFGRRIAEENRLLRESFILERFVPSPSWIVKAIQCTEEELLAAAGLDAVAFNRLLVFRYSRVFFVLSRFDLRFQFCTLIHSFFFLPPQHTHLLPSCHSVSFWNSSTALFRTKYASS